MSQFIKFDRSTITPEHERPKPERVIEGDPQFTTWLLETTPDEKIYAGYWAATPGTWRVCYDEWEYCTILEGHAVVTEDGQPPVTLKAGDHIVFRDGYQGQWQVIEPVLKTFVIILP
jgi:uncharacterized cupin superfamily protein